MDSAERFTNRVDNYVKYRPGYPAAIVPFLESEFGLQSASVVADIGSGPGKLSQVFLDAGYTVHAVEPNQAMREAAQELFGERRQFHNLEGRAEQTNLADRSVDLIVAGQAFHWFDQSAARREFGRILRPRGGVALIWNNRRAATSEFLQAYEDMLHRHCPDYPNVGNKHYDAGELRAFFAPGAIASRVFEYAQILTREELHGRVQSSSYAPAEGPPHAALRQAVDALFHKYARHEVVHVPYDTELHYGCFEPRT